jgi:hypothetical protein
MISIIQQSCRHMEHHDYLLFIVMYVIIIHDIKQHSLLRNRMRHVSKESSKHGILTNNYRYVHTNYLSKERPTQLRSPIPSSSNIILQKIMNRR